MKKLLPYSKFSFQKFQTLFFSLKNVRLRTSSKDYSIPNSIDKNKNSEINLDDKSLEEVLGYLNTCNIHTIEYWAQRSGISFVHFDLETKAVYDDSISFNPGNPLTDKNGTDEKLREDQRRGQTTEKWNEDFEEREKDAEMSKIKEGNIFEEPLSAKRSKNVAWPGQDDERMERMDEKSRNRGGKSTLDMFKEDEICLHKGIKISPRASSKFKSIELSFDVKSGDNINKIKEIINKGFDECPVNQTLKDVGVNLTHKINYI